MPYHLLNSLTNKSFTFYLKVIAILVIICSLVIQYYAVASLASGYKPYIIIVRNNQGKQWTLIRTNDDNNTMVQFFRPSNPGERAKLCLPNQVVTSIAVNAHEHKVYVYTQSIGYVHSAKEVGIERWPKDSIDDKQDEGRDRE